MAAPPLLLLSAYGGVWAAYEDALAHVFETQIGCRGVSFRGKWVNQRRGPVTRGRSAAFWHLIQEGPIEDEREPNLRRCERLPWVRYIIDSAGSDPDIDEWENVRGPERNVLLWYKEEYIVILSERPKYFVLKTAYDTSRPNRIRQLRNERDSA